MNKKKKKEKDFVPELRFPRFKNAKSWEEKKLNEVADVNPKVFELPHQFVYIDLESVENGILLKKRILRREEAPSRAQRLLKENDIIFQLVRPYQKNNYYFLHKDDLEYVASTGYAQIRSIGSSLYLYYFLHTDYFVANVLTKCTGSNYPAISSSDLAKLIIQIPEIKEQQKIAECLSSIDETIRLEKEKLDKLKDYKKGLMQTIFTQDGELYPKFRFKEFKKDDPWCNAKLVDLGYFLGGGTPDRSKTEYWEGKIPWVSSSDINESDLNNIAIRRNINNDSIKQSATKLIPKGSVLFVSRVGVGKIAVNNIPLCTSQDFINFVPKEGMDNRFIGYYFLSKVKLLISLNQGTSIKGFTKNDLENIVLRFPIQNEEQQQIASCLSSLDDLITAQTEKIELLGQHKKGLMQGLFPKTN